MAEQIGNMTTQPISILGSTGSIGVSALTVVDRYPERLRVVALAGGTNAKLLAEQVLRYQPEIVALADSAQEASFRKALGGFPKAFGLDILQTAHQ